MGVLISRLWAFVRAAAANQGVRIGAGTTAITIGIGELRQEAVRVAPTSDPEALEEAARQVLRMLGKDGTDVRGPRDIRDWNYFHMNMSNGQTWFTRKYISKKGQNALMRARTAAPSRIVAGGSRSGTFSRWRR